MLCNIVEGEAGDFVSTDANDAWVDLKAEKGRERLIYFRHSFLFFCSAFPCNERRRFSYSFKSVTLVKRMPSCLHDSLLLYFPPLSLSLSLSLSLAHTYIHRFIQTHTLDMYI